MSTFANVASSFVVLPVYQVVTANGCTCSPEGADSSFTSNLLITCPDTATTGEYVYSAASRSLEFVYRLERAPAVRFAEVDDPGETQLTAAAGPPETEDLSRFSEEYIAARELSLAKLLHAPNALVLIHGEGGIKKIGSISGEDLNCKYIALEITNQEGRKKIAVLILLGRIWHGDVAQAFAAIEGPESVVRVVAAGQLCAPDWLEKTIWRNGKSGGYPTERNTVRSPDDIRITNPLKPADNAGIEILDRILAQYFPGYAISSFPDIG